MGRERYLRCYQAINMRVQVKLIIDGTNLSVFTMLETHKGFGDTIIFLYVCMYVGIFVQMLPSDF